MEIFDNSTLDLHISSGVRIKVPGIRNKQVICNNKEDRNYKRLLKRWRFKTFVMEIADYDLGNTMTGSSCSYLIK